MFVILAMVGLVLVIIISIKDMFSKRNVYYLKPEKEQKKSA